MGVIFALLVLAVPMAPVWQEVVNEDGVVVWAREVEGSPVREVKAETLIDVTAERVWDVLSRTEHYLEFMPYLVETKKLDPTEDGHYEYQRIDPPIVDMRDYTVRIHLRENAGKGWCERAWEPANDKGPARREDSVRIEINRGSWSVERAPGGARVRYYVYTDPGGNIPAWIANKANTTSVPDLMRAVRNRAKNPEWRRN